MVKYSDDEKEYKKKLQQAKWDSGSHLQGSFGSASLSWLEERNFKSIPIRFDGVKVLSWNDLIVQTEWDRGAFRL